MEESKRGKTVRANDARIVIRSTKTVSERLVRDSLREAKN